MMRKDALTVALSLVVLGGTGSSPAAQAPRDYPFKPVPFTAVHLDDVFWAPRIETNRVVTIPFAFDQCEQNGRMGNFERAAAALQGKPLTNTNPPPYPFDDTDPYKVLEGASYALAVKPDPKLDAYLDSLIAKIAPAQEPDGYLYTARTINPKHPHEWSGTNRWLLDPKDSHELYDAGHLFEAAVAHFQSTGKRTLLNIALKEADLLCQTFGPEPTKLHIWPGHEIVEMGLAKLYRVTGEQRYLDLAKYFIDVRGSYSGGDEYHQSHTPPVKQSEAVGHAVRAGYLYSGMADVAALTGDSSYLRAMDNIWGNVVNKKLYITGGVGATGSGEKFGPNYFLPNMSAYCETCAAVANDYWNERLFLLHGDAKYVDVMERTLYNGLISGVSLDGKSFFYPNPLESSGQHERKAWFGVACCPGNITRFLASIPGYVYAQQGDTIFVNLYAGGTADIKLDSGRTVRLKQETRYPWDGAVKMTVETSAPGPFTINVRIPGWARNEVVFGSLYKFTDRNNDPVTLMINGTKTSVAPKLGYAILKREWKSGDIIDLNFPMPVRRVQASTLIESDRGRVAIQRGPLLFCAEWPDNPNHKVRNLLLPDNQELTASFEPSLLNGVEVIKGRAYAVTLDDTGKTIKTEQDFKAIPYYAWANRGSGEMAVWIANSEKSVKPSPKPTLASMSRVTVSNPQAGKSPTAMNDLQEPRASNDEENPFFDWWPRKGTEDWVEYAFPEPATVSQAEVYWFDDTGTGDCRVPASWRVLYKDGDQWKPVETSAPYGVATNRFNKVLFNAVTTSGLRLEVKAQPEWAAGIQEWKVGAPSAR